MPRNTSYPEMPLKASPKKCLFSNFTIFEYDSLTSASDLALQLTKSNALPPDSVILANSQTGGRGRYSRKWISPAGNLYFSFPVHLAPNKTGSHGNHPAQLSFISVIALKSAIDQLIKDGLSSPVADPAVDLTLAYKWPNDLLLNGGKLAGILLESDSSIPHTTIIGIGVNISSHPESSLSYRATSLAHHNIASIEPPHLLKLFLTHFLTISKKWRELGFTPIRNLWLKDAANLNKEISVNLPDGQKTGIFQAIDDQGNLLLKTTNTSDNNTAKDKIITVSSGEIWTQL